MLQFPENPNMPPSTDFPRHMITQGHYISIRINFEQTLFWGGPILVTAASSSNSGILALAFRLGVCVLRRSTLGSLIA